MRIEDDGGEPWPACCGSPHTSDLSFPPISELRLLRLPADALLAAAGMVYLGPLPEAQRSRLCGAWDGDMELKRLLRSMPAAAAAAAAAAANDQPAAIVDLSPSGVLSLLLGDELQVGGWGGE